MRTHYLLGSLSFVGVVLVACGGGVSLGDANQGLGNGSSGSSGTSGSGTGAKKDCSQPNACGPALGMPAQQCSDGSVGGNTGRCLATATGECAWEIRECPTNPNACFDQKGELDASMRACNPAAASPMAQCVVVEMQQNCCGTMRAVGVNTKFKDQAQKCGDERRAKFPQCGCAMMPTIADDGSTAGSFNEKATVTCTAQGRCETTFKSGDPCAGVTLPACPRECAQFPETGACAAGDRCRLAGSKIGDECSCNGGTWACMPHPPLGTGCNLVCR